MVLVYRAQCYLGYQESTGGLATYSLDLKEGCALESKTGNVVSEVGENKVMGCQEGTVNQGMQRASRSW